MLYLFSLKLINTEKGIIIVYITFMKSLLLSFFLSFSIFAQDFSTIKEKTNKYPGLLTAEKLAKHIASDFSSEEDKVKALFCWMTKNIRYDLEEYYNPSNKRTTFRYRTIEEKNTIIQGIKDKTVSETLKRRKGVCEGYAQTFAKVATLLNIENAVISGYARASFNEIGNPIQQPNHAWNAVKIKNNWTYIDATWGAGHQNNGKWHREFKPYFFNMKKEHYFKTHLPEESVWRLKVNRMDKITFYKQPIYSHRFLTTNYKLISPANGFIKKDKNGKITVSLKNIAPNQKIHFGFLGDQYAKEGAITIKNGITTASILPPTNASLAFLMIDLEVMLHFKVL